MFKCRKLLRSLSSVLIAALLVPAVCVFAKDNPVGEKPQLKFVVTDCTNGEKNGKIKAELQNYDENAAYSISFDSGKKFYPMKGAEKTLIHAEKGFYSICVQKIEDEIKWSDIYTVYVGSDEEKFSVKVHFISSNESIYKDGKIQALIDNYDDEKEYELVLDNGRKIIPFKKSRINIISLSAGKYKISVREVSSDKLRHSPTFTVEVGENKLPKREELLVKMILQNPELPTGCEITSLAMLLDYIGFESDKVVIAEKYLEKGKYRASDPNEVFVGEPTSTFAYGCYADVIVKSAKKFLEENDTDKVWEVRNITGCDTKALYSAVGNGCPVIVWATVDMKAPQRGAEWTIPETNRKYIWTAGEHCLLLTGYDSKAKIVYVNDPLKGKVTYSQTEFEKRFIQMGRNAVIIVKTDQSS
ncbi:MAG: C39 family peptidase [Oscillospiraceae bacterium]